MDLDRNVVIETSTGPTLVILSATQGPAGPAGADGDGAGNAVTVAVGTVTALAPNATPTVTNSGTSADAVFDFGIPAGAAGADGAQGPQGPKGDTGDTGAAGATGATGSTGSQGPQGPKGDTGAAGADGSQGPQGIQGATGSTGPKGDTGDQGIQGPIGLTGADGAQGIQGPKGDTGAAGADGATGPKGDTGDQGIQGPQGPSGGSTNWRGAWSSASTYAVYDAVSYLGSSYIATASSTNAIPSTTPADWQLLAQAGADGATGATGADGSQGPQGIQGVAGTAGSDGAAATVAVGTVTTGAAGSSAVIVNAGTSSAATLNFTIPKGDKGDTGSTGTAGTPGTPGTAATVAVGTVTTGAAGSSAVVTNSGTSSAAVLDFTIPQGIQGTAGSGGSSGPSMIVPRDLNWHIAVVYPEANGFSTVGMYLGNSSAGATYSQGIDPAGYVYATYPSGTTANTSLGIVSVKSILAGKNPSYRTIYTLLANTNVQCYLGLATYVNATIATSNLLSGGIGFVGFRYFSSADGGNWAAYIGNGTSCTVADTGVAVDTTQMQVFDVIWVAGVPQFYINCVRVAAGISTAYLPGPTEAIGAIAIHANTTTASISSNVFQLYQGAN